MDYSYLALNAVVIGDGLLRIATHPQVVGGRATALTAELSSPIDRSDARSVRAANAVPIWQATIPAKVIVVFLR